MSISTFDIEVANSMKHEKCVFHPWVYVWACVSVVFCVGVSVWVWVTAFINSH